MLDLLHLPSRYRANVQVFTRAGVTASPTWQTWRKPRGAAMVYFLCIGSGGGGGGGSQNASGNRGGGGGGASSGASRLICSASVLPDVLYVEIAPGGAGSTQPSAGGSGRHSYVAVAPNTTVQNMLIISGNGNAGGGTAGGTGAPGTGGTAATIATIAQMPLAGLGHFAFIAGLGGAHGGDDAGAVGDPITFAATGVLNTGGSGGGGTSSANFDGGEFSALADSWLSEQRPATATAASPNGSGGPQLWKPFFSFGGAGGAALTAGAGGHGGNGAFGAGGGGGGGGTTGGRGGNGGNGVVIIVTW